MHRNEVATLLESVVLILVAGFSLFATDAQREVVRAKLWRLVRRADH
jgi:hypothetical protein